MASEKAAANWLENPAVPYAVIGLLIVGVLVILPWLVKRLFQGGQEAFNAGSDLAFNIGNRLVDTGSATIGEISSIVGKPSTEAPAGVTPGVAGQSFTDKLKGLLAGGDSRTWSDLIG